MMMPLVVVSMVLFAIRLYAAARIGFGDSEALYAGWAVHPQPAYLDHPGLVGLVARAIGEGAVPSAVRTHLVTAGLATIVPWLVVATARAFGARERPAMLAGLLVALVPEMAVGLFALTPDLLLAPLWIGAIAFAGIGLRSVPGETRSAASFLGAGLLAGIACSAKISGVLLVLALLVAFVSVARSDRPESKAARTIWPWIGLATGLVVVLPIAFYEAKRGFPMLHHRLVATQDGAGLAVRNLGALVGGQILYLSPVVAWLAIRAARDLVRDRSRDALSRLSFFVFVVPLVPLVGLTLWSRVAEPHWIAPALLVLPIHAARRATWEEAKNEKKEPSTKRLSVSRKLFVTAAIVAGLFTLAVHAWVLVPASARLLPEDADPKLDLASELYGWPTVINAVHEQMSATASPYDPEGREVVVVGPHWTVCAQLQAGLPGVRVGCATPIPDDFDQWFPRKDWRNAEHVLFVTDNRFGGDGADELPSHVRTAQSRVRILRGGRTARVFELYLYENRASGMRDVGSVVRQASR